MGTHLFDNLPDVLKKYEGALYDTVTLVAQKAALAAGTYLGQETPVDTGVARSNWVATIGAPFEGIVPAYFPYPSYRTNHHEAVKTAVIHHAPVRVRKIKLFTPKLFKGATV